MQLILDIGSCHCGKLDYAKESIDLAAEVGATIKFQLFKGSENGNIELPRKFWPELVEYAKSRTDIFASAFDEEAIQLLYDTGIKKVKLSYHQNFNLKLIRKARELGLGIWASGDYNRYPHYADKKFFCIPEYPPEGLRFSSITYSDFDGFSSHYLGWQVERAQNLLGLKYLEKHFTLDHDDIDCPDHWFALLPKELKEASSWLKQLQ